MKRGKCLALFAAMAMVVCAFALIMPAEESDAAPNTQYYSGILGNTQAFGEGTNVIINDTLTITKNGVLTVNGDFTINSGVKVTIKDGGQLIVTGGKVTINGEVTVTGSGINTNNEDYNAESPEATPSTFAINSDDEEDVTIPDFSNKGVTINKSVTVTSGAEFSAENGNILINNNGILNVTKSGSNVGKISGIAIYVAVGGTFDFGGKATNDVTVSAYGTGSVFTLGSATITPNASADAKVPSDMVFTTVSSSYTAYYVGNNEIDTQTIRQYALNVNGSVANMDELKLSGSIYKTEEDKSIALDTTQYYTSKAAAENAKNNRTIFYYNDKVMGNVTIADSLVVKSTAKLCVNETAYLDVIGTLTVNETTDTSKNVTPTVTIKGIIEVQGTVNLNAGSIVDERGSPGTIGLNGGSMTVDDYSDYNGLLGFYGAFYVNDKDDIAYFSDLSSAISGATAANVDEVQVWGIWGSKDTEYGSYIIETDLTIPAGMTLKIGSGVSIKDEVTVTFESDSNVEFDYGKLYVNGKLIDKSLEFESYEVDGTMVFEVKSVSADELTNTYTSLAIALKETESGTIYLYNNVKIDGTMTIKENVTVQYADDLDIGTNTTAGITFEDKDATLVINGTLYLAGSHTLNTSATDGNGTVTVNNVIRYDSESAITGDVAGAYFEAQIGDNDACHYITNVAYAAENSIYTDEITINGAVNLGDVTFTQGDVAINGLAVKIVNTGSKIATGNVVKLSGDVTFDMAKGAYTGSIQSDVTSGTSVISFNKSKGSVIGFDYDEGVDSTTSVMTIEGTMVTGTVTVVSGSLSTAADADKVGFYEIVVSSGSTLIVSEGGTVSIATPYYDNILDYVGDTSDDDEQKKAIKELFNGLGINNSLPLYTSDRIAELAGLTVDGTVVINGTLAVLFAQINGTVNIEDEGNVEFLLAQIDGTVNNSGDNEATVTVAAVNGTMAGHFDIYGMLVYPGSDVSNAIFNSPTGKTSSVDKSVIYINGAEYATVYGDKDVDVPVMAILMFANVAGCDEDTAKFFTDAEMTNAISNMDSKGVADAYSNLVDKMRAGSGAESALNALIEKLSSGAAVGDYDNVYISMQPSKVIGSITVYTGMSLYIDGQSINHFAKYDGNGAVSYELSVGQHQFSVQVTPGLTGTPVLSINGQTVSGGSFTIDDNAKSFQIVVTGDITQNIPVVDGGNSGSDDDGMGLTDILLIVLVVLIAVMAVMVALRLMRS